MHSIDKLASRTRRRSYTAVFMTKVVEFVERNRNRSAEKEFDVNEKQIQDWKKKKVNYMYNIYLLRVDRSKRSDVCVRSVR